MFVTAFYLCNFKINIDKTSQKVTKDKDPKRFEAACKGREKYMNKLKESILNNVQKGSGDTTNASNETTSTTANASNETTSPANNTTTTRSNDTYVYGVGILAVLAIGICVFFGYNTFQPKKLINEKKRSTELHVFKKPI